MLVDPLTLKRNIEKKEKRIRYWDIEFAIVDSGKLYVLGEKSGFFRNTYFDIVCDASTGGILEENIFKRFGELSYRKKDVKYHDRKWKLERLYLKRLEESVKDIRVYQGTIDEVSEDLGKELERVDINQPETFIQAPDSKNKNLALRLLAKYLGADAIVHYQPGSALGTPVRFVDKKDDE